MVLARSFVEAFPEAFAQPSAEIGARRAPRPVGAIPTIDPRWDGRFRRLTGCGNAAFRAGRAVRAERLYRGALREAERVYAAASHEAGAVLVAPMVLTIAANNLADALARAGTVGGARALPVEAVERLIATARSPGEPIAFRLNCVRHLPRALAFAAGHDAEGSAAVAHLVERAAAAAAEVTRTARHWRRAGPAGSSVGSRRGQGLS